MSLSKSSLLDLKAELLKKTEEIKNQKLQRASVANEKRKLHKKTSLFSRKNAGVSERAQKDFEAKVEEDDALTKSRKKLEAKARIYAKMTGGSGVSNHDGSKGFLVDFEQKSIHNISDKREQERIKREEEEMKEDEDLLNESVDESLDPSEQWIDYVDSFGRSRRCLRKDLPELERMDRKLTENNSDTAADDSKPEMTSTALYREQVRLKWEEEERKNMTDPDGPLHYSNIQHEEIRTHGTGYYQFDRDLGSRQDQMDALKDLREQTKDLREKKALLKQKRKAILKARLAKVKKRKLIREGKTEAELEEEESSESEEEHMIGPQLGEVYKGDGRESPEQLTRDESLRQGAPTRDWDKGKTHDVVDEDKWLDDRRDERVNEFAPPTSYRDFKSRPNRKQPEPMTSSSTSPPPDFAPPSNYFTTTTKPATKSKFKLKCGNLILTKPTKKVAANPMAFLEEKAENESESKELPTQREGVSIERKISAGLSAIRSQVDSTTGINKLPSSLDVNRTKTPPSEYLPNEKREGFTSSDSGVWSAQSYPPQMNAPYPQFGPPRLPADMSFIPPPPPPPPGFNPYSMSTDTYQAPPSQYPPGYPPGYPHVYQDYAQVPNDTVHTNQTPYANEEPTAHLHNIITESLPTSTTATVSAEPESNKTKYSSAPVKYDRFTAAPVKTRYERVNLYDVPDSLPAPPTMVNVPVYPSQEEVFGTKTKETNEKNLQRTWNRQFQKNDTAAKHDGKALSEMDVKSSVIGRVKSLNIPFVSPYVQTEKQHEVDTDVNEDKIDFDPAKPPPNLTPQNEQKSETSS